MKVLVVTNLYPPMVMGGYEILCEAVVGRFTARGHAVAVQTSSDPTSPAACKKAQSGRFQESIHRNLRLFLPFHRPAAKARLRHFLTSHYNEWQTARLIARDKPDIVFFWSQRRLSLGSVWAAQKSSVPYAMTLNDTFLLAYRPVPLNFSPRRAVACLLEWTVFARTTYRGLRLPAVTAISQSLREDYLQAATPLEHTRVIYQGAELDNFTLKPEPGSLHQPARLLYVGQLHDYKGVHVAVDAIALLTKKGFQLTLTIIGAGDSEYENRLREQTAELDIGEQVRFLGKLPRDQLPAQYQQHDVLIFPSLWDEPFGLTHLEAMACGTPVISTRCGGAGEFLRDGRNALTFAAGNAEQLAERVIELLEKPELRKAIAVGGRREVERNFDFERYARDLETFLLNTIANWPKLKSAVRSF